MKKRRRWVFSKDDYPTHVVDGKSIRGRETAREALRKILGGVLPDGLVETDSIGQWIFRERKQ